MASDSYKLDYNKVFGGSSRKLVLGVIVLAVVIYGVWQYGTAGKGEKAESGREALTPSAGVPAQTYAEACSKFSVTEGEVSCEEAARIAEEKTGGAVRKVSQGSVRIVDHSTNKRKSVSAWMIDVEFSSPYFDSAFQRDIRFLRVGVGLNENIGIYEEPLESIA